MPKAIGRAMELPLRHGCTVRAAVPSYNLSVCFADSSPSRGASGEEAKLYEMPRPPLGRSNSDDCSGADRCQLRMLRAATRSLCPKRKLPTPV